MLEIGDYVKLIDFDKENLEKDNEIFIGEKGVITKKDRRDIYPYNVKFFNKEIQQKNMDWGCLYWREEDLVKIN